jgi:hypothetical protein
MTSWILRLTAWGMNVQDIVLCAIHRFDDGLRPAVRQLDDVDQVELRRSQREGLAKRRKLSSVNVPGFHAKRIGSIG